MNFDSRGRLSGKDKVDIGGTVLTSYVSSIAYNVAGQVTGLSSGSGVNEIYTYSSDRLQLTRQTATKGATTLMDLNYSYAATAVASGTGTTAGNSGQLMGIVNNPSAQPSTINGQNRNQAFTSDDGGRVVTATGWSQWQRRYAYDRWGNRTGVWDATTGGNQIQSVTLQQQPGAPTGVPSNRATTITNNGVPSTKVYDAAGNLTGDGAHSYQYDGEGRLASVDNGAATYFYDSGNHRLKKVTGGSTTYYVWEGAQVIAEYSSASAGAGGNSYYLADRLSNWMVTDNNGAFKGTQDHQPFGEEGGTSGASEKHRFTNYERDNESGSDYAINRQYETANGRFKQPDIVGGSIGDPQSLNRYAYSLNDPVNVGDLLGLDPYFLDASKHGPGVYLDGVQVMPEMWGMVFSLWARGAADIDFPGRALLNQLPEWYKKEYHLQNPNDLWRLLPIGLMSGGSDSEEHDACVAMATRAQQIANSARFKLGHTQAAVEQFDRNFSQAYLGNNGLGKTYGSALSFFNAPIRPQVPRSQLGESGFAPWFQDHEGDQTHHFAAYLSAGINNQGLAAGLHMLTDMTNQADRSLGAAAYELGERLTANPGNLMTIGSRIRHDICR